MNNEEASHWNQVLTDILRINYPMPTVFRNRRKHVFRLTLRRAKRRAYREWIFRASKMFAEHNRTRGVGSKIPRGKAAR